MANLAQIRTFHTIDRNIVHNLLQDIAVLVFANILYIVVFSICHQMRFFALYPYNCTYDDRKNAHSKFSDFLQFNKLSENYVILDKPPA